MFAESIVQDSGGSPVAAFSRMFALEEVGWLSNEACIARMFGGHEVWVDDPDLRQCAFRRLAYHPRLGTGAAKLAGIDLAVERTTMLYARRGMISPDAPYWRAAEPEAIAGYPLAIVFLGDAEVALANDGFGGSRRIRGRMGDVAILPSRASRLTATTDRHLVPLFLVHFGPLGVRRRGGRPVASPNLTDDCLWQPPHWTAG